MEVETILKILVLVVGFYMAWNIGANDVSNAMGTSVGSGALTLRKAVILAAILEFSGAFFVGGSVSETIQKGIVDTTIFSADPMILVLGMCAALLGTGIWLQIASYKGWPVSTTHAIVGAIFGFGALISLDAVKWGEIGFIALSWIISPLSSAILSYTLFNILQRKILYAMSPVQETKKLMPFFVFLIFSVFTLSCLANGLKNLHLEISFSMALGIAILVGLLAALITYTLVQRLPFLTEYAASPSRHTPQTVVSLEKAIKHLQRVRSTSHDEAYVKVTEILNNVKILSNDLRKETSLIERTSEYNVVEKMFVFLQIMSACFIAFAHGANDVANAIGPVAAVLDTIKNGVMTEASVVPSWLLAFGGVGIVIGLATWGWRVIETIGKKITELTPTRGFCAEFGAATTILIASKLGLPISTTHCLVGSVLGVGLARGFRALNLSMLRDILLSWIVTIPASAIMTIIAFYILKFFIRLA